MRLLRGLGGVALSAALVTVVAAAPAGANHSWGGYHWARSANPFNLTVEDHVGNAWNSVFDTTVADWTSSRMLDLTKVSGPDTTKKTKNCSAVSGRVTVCNATYGNNGWLGIAQIWLSGDHITQGSVKLNDTYFNTSTYNTVAWRNLVSCQEVGHTLGLDHQDENFSNANLGTCMDYTNSPSTNQHPNAHDYQQLETIYTHLDSTTTVGASGASTVPAGEGRAEWGRSQGRSADGHSETFERSIGNGEKLVTHVVWAEGA